MWDVKYAVWDEKPGRSGFSREGHGIEFRSEEARGSFQYSNPPSLYQEPGISFEK